MDQTNHFGKVFTPKCVLSCLLFNCFISYAILLGREKGKRRGSVAHAAERLTGFFFTTQNNQVYYIAGYICTLLFVLCLVQLGNR